MLYSFFFSFSSFSEIVFHFWLFGGVYWATRRCVPTYPNKWKITRGKAAVTAPSIYFFEQAEKSQKKRKKKLKRRIIFQLRWSFIPYRYYGEWDFQPEKIKTCQSLVPGYFYTWSRATRKSRRRWFEVEETGCTNGSAARIIGNRTKDLGGGMRDVGYGKPLKPFNGILASKTPVTITWP